MPNPAEIAAKLTEHLLPGEMAAFLWLPNDGSWSRKHAHDTLPPDYPGDGLFCLWANKSPLIQGSGLTTGFARYRLSETGLAVRAHMEQADDPH